MKINIGNIRRLFEKVKPSAKEPAKKDSDLLTEAIEAAQAECRFNLNEDMRAKYADFLENSPIKENYILYEAFGGRGMTCSPHAIFRYLLAQAEFQDFVHVWAIDDFEDNEGQTERYRDYGNVKFVKHQSIEYREYLATCKYLINNVSFPGYFTKRKEQVYVDTWHGIPLKTLGFDIPGGSISAGNSAKNLLAADYLVSPNKFMTEIYKKAFKLEGLYDGTILEVGQPRNDGYFHTEREEIVNTLREAGVDIDPDKKLILYAPTWKGSKYSSPDTSLEAYFKIIQTIEEQVDTKEYQVLVKPHQIVYYHIKKTQGITGQFVPATVDTNQLLSVTDVLISDYSSIYFDYLVSGKPILFFIPDLDEYLGYRGLYFGIDKLPGPIARTYEELAELVKNPEKAMEPYREKYQEEAAWACPKDDGEVCARLADVVFRGKTSGEEVKCGHTGKKKVLLYAGDFEERDATFSAVTLLKYLDYDKFDVTLLVGCDGNEAAEARVCSLPKELRVLYRGQPFNATAEETARHNLLLKGDSGTEPPEALYKREVRRLFGEARFDYAVDLSGGDKLFAQLVRAMENTKLCRFERMLVDTWRIKEELEQPVIVSEKDSYYLASIEESGDTVLTVETVEAPDPEKTNYAAMGAKDYKEVVSAFEAVQRENKDARLYLLGKGKDCENLKRPFGFLSMCDYFVCGASQKESDLAVLEAKALGMNILKADCVTKTEYAFDAEAYNQEARREFEGLLGEGNEG